MRVTPKECHAVRLVVLSVERLIEAALTQPGFSSARQSATMGFARNVWLKLKCNECNCNSRVLARPIANTSTADASASARRPRFCVRHSGNFGGGASLNDNILSVGWMLEVGAVRVQLVVVA